MPSPRTTHPAMMTLYWIDDSHDNQRLPKGAAKRQLEKGLKATLQPGKPISDRAEFVELLLRMDPKTTCGVIMDYQLTEVGDKQQMAYGTTWAAEIRAKHPSVPVIGISHCLEKDIPTFQLENFLAFFPRKQLTDANPRIDDLRSLLTGHRSAYRAFEKQGKKSGVQLMIKLVKPPAGTVDLLESAIPSPFRGKWDQETPHAAGRWIWHELQGRPGFLFDELGLATHLGLNLKGLGLVRAEFEAARFRGVFASDERPRWWVGLVRPIVEKAVGQKVVGPVSNARIDFLTSAGIKSGEQGALLSRPHGRSGATDVPNCVAYRDDEREDDYRVQALFHDTYVDDRDSNPAFGFEPRRVYASHGKK